MSVMTKKSGAVQIAEERERQQKVEGWDAAHDTGHWMGELTEAALCYAAVASAQARGSGVEEWPVGMFNGHNDSILQWPWEDDAYKPSPDIVRNLVKAGALIAAEIDRLNRKGVNR